MGSAPPTGMEKSTTHKLRPYLGAILATAIAAVVGGLVLSLVYGIVHFGERVTSYYAPTILAYDNLLEAASHLRHEAEAGPVLPSSSALMHFNSALAGLDWVLGKEEHGHVEIEHQTIMTSGRAIAAAIPAGKTPDMAVLDSYIRTAETHVAFHRKELDDAKAAIRSFSLATAGLCLLILAMGVVVGLRETRLAEVRRREGEMVSALLALVNALDARDPYTRGHSERVARYAVGLGRRLGLGRRELERLHLAATLHDIGKIGVRDAILLKEGRLDEEEFAAMRQHPAIAARMLGSFPNLADIVPGILHHHERWDGKGYPEGRAGEDIPMQSRIIALADAYDAMTSSRPYRRALAPDAAVVEMRRCAGAQWPHDLTEAYLAILGSERSSPDERHATLQTGHGDIR